MVDVVREYKFAEIYAKSATRVQEYIDDFPSFVVLKLLSNPYRCCILSLLWIDYLRCHGPRKRGQSSDQNIKFLPYKDHTSCGQPSPERLVILKQLTDMLNTVLDDKRDKMNAELSKSHKCNLKKIFRRDHGITIKNNNKDTIRITARGNAIKLQEL